MDSGEWDSAEFYRASFRDINKFAPYPYQVELAARLTQGQNLCLRAPTGSGKTRAVLTPFVCDDLPWPNRPARLIYALPLRSLVTQIHAEAADLLRQRHRPESEATIQTGDQPDDEFFAKGRIIVTTYDQVLSGLLCAPYGLSRNQRNLNAGALVGSLVVFDEFHLMGLGSAFLTGAAGLRLFRSAAQSVWMTATATEAPIRELRATLKCASLDLSPEETQALPAIAMTQRQLRWADSPIQADAIKAHPDGRVIVIVNTVGRAQQLYRDLEDWARIQGIPLRCLHGRFFKSDRDQTVRELAGLLGEGKRGRAILIATQVIEAGINISCEHLHTELCPMNTLLQRAGRCARFVGEQGTIYLHPLPSTDRNWLPYGTAKKPDEALEPTETIVRGQEIWTMTPEIATEWVQAIHGGRDQKTLAEIGWRSRSDAIKERICANLAGKGEDVSELIRPSTDAQVRVIIAPGSNLPDSPARREALGVSRGALRSVLGASGVAWRWDLSTSEPHWESIDSPAALEQAYVIALDPSVARYSSADGLTIGEPGVLVSPDRIPPERPGYRPYRRESWTTHAAGVMGQIEERWARDGAVGLTAAAFLTHYQLTGPMTRDLLRAAGLIHDLGKLQQPWQDWANRWQADRDPAWVAREPLAHTDFNREDPADRERATRIRGRGPHARASAAYGVGVLKTLLTPIPASVRRAAVSAAVAAVLSHHGGWIPDHGSELEITPLIRHWDTWVREVIHAPPGVEFQGSAAANKRSGLEDLLKATINPDYLQCWFALVAYLMRAVRLSDWGATAEGGESE